VEKKTRHMTEPLKGKKLTTHTREKRVTKTIPQKIKINKKPPPNQHQKNSTGSKKPHRPTHPPQHILPPGQSPPSARKRIPPCAYTKRARSPSLTHPTRERGRRKEGGEEEKKTHETAGLLSVFVVKILISGELRLGILGPNGRMQ